MALCGYHDEYLKIITETLQIEIFPQGNQLLICGSESKVLQTEALLKQLQTFIRQGIAIGAREVTYGAKKAMTDELSELETLFNDVIFHTLRGKQIRPKTMGQKVYIDTIRKNDIVFGIGPAGTGKTYLAMAAAVAALKDKQVQRLILCRPAVEAGERLGFLPGDLQDKVDPYLRPLYDALYDMVGIENFQRYQEKGIIEVAPLAYMRGRTLDDAFIILDEAQNTTLEQMKMFLTRLGFGSKAVITGDVTQVDLAKGTGSGLILVQDILRDVAGIGFVYLTEQDVVRHRLVQKVIRAFEKYQTSVSTGRVGETIGK
ncbi:MAG: PhoH family protein [Negativicutes bacterium]|nr:PhoH family protein [Negativicutes bacterium]